MMIEFTPNVVYVNGVGISFELLDFMTRPNKNCIINFQRVGDTVIGQKVELRGDWIGGIRDLKEFDESDVFGMGRPKGKLLAE